MNTVINLKTMTTGLLASLLMAGSALAMDSDAIEAHMAKISEQAAESEGSRVEALETQVEELKNLIRMLMEEDDSGN